MKFSVSRDALIKPLNLVAGVVERRQTLPILSNVLMSLEGNRLSLTGTDLEVELVGRIDVQSGSRAPRSPDRRWNIERPGTGRARRQHLSRAHVPQNSGMAIPSHSVCQI